MNNHDKYISDILSKKDKKGNVVVRESSTIEFKENFNFSCMAEYSKIMASFANNSGGYLIFGIKDNPRKLTGINLDKFNEINQEKITSFLLEYFNPEIRWDIGLVEYNGVYIGYIYTYEAESKPIICKKNKDNIIKTGEIYYRYSGNKKY
jgi:predicted HTH transcriptional regulator